MIKINIICLTNFDKLCGYWKLLNCKIKLHRKQLRSVLRTKISRNLSVLSCAEFWAKALIEAIFTSSALSKLRDTNCRKQRNK